MAHLIKLSQLDLTHDNTNTYIPILFNLDRATTIEPSPSGKHSVITTSQHNSGIRVKETLDEILKLSRSLVKGDSVLNG